MAATARIEGPSAPLGAESGRRSSALSRYFEISLFLMLLVSVLALVSTGKLDLATILLAPVALLAKGYRWWRARDPEFSRSTAPFLLVIYLLIFPAALRRVSRGLSPSPQKPASFRVIVPRQQCASSSH